jgi:hypothetical protein
MSLKKFKSMQLQIIQRFYFTPSRFFNNKLHKYVPGLNVYSQLDLAIPDLSILSSLSLFKNPPGVANQ